MRVVFMGTPDFAVSSLAALYEDGGYDIQVFTRADKARIGHEVEHSPVGRRCPGPAGLSAGKPEGR